VTAWRPAVGSSGPRRVGLPSTVASAVAVVLTLTFDAPCRANGRFPSANQLAFAPADSDFIVLRTTYGILPSHDNGATWGYICEDVLGLGPGAEIDPVITVTANDSLIAGDIAGLNVSADNGCNWTCQGGPLATLPVVDVAIRPDSPHSAVALTSAFEVSDSAAYNIDSRVFETRDDGVMWTQIGSPLPNDLVAATIEVTKTDAARLYVSGMRGRGSTASAWLYVSMDGGSMWQGTQLPPSVFDPSREMGVYIGGVDPTNASRLYLRSRSSPLATGGRSRLTVVDVATSGTPAFQSVHSLEAGAGLDMTGEMLGFAISPDGSKLYVGTEEDGLWAALSSALIFQKKSSIAVGCLATRGGELWACSTAASGFVVGISSDDGATFTPKLSRVGALTGPIACAANASGAGCNASQNGSLCGDAWGAFCQTVPCGLDGGGAVSAPPSLTAPLTSPRSTSCAVAGAPSQAFFGEGWTVTAIAASVAAAARKRVTTQESFLRKSG
jgi:hypothetical protein